MSDDNVVRLDDRRKPKRGSRLPVVIPEQPEPPPDAPVHAALNIMVQDYGDQYPLAFWIEVDCEDAFDPLLDQTANRLRTMADALDARRLAGQLDPAGEEYHPSDFDVVLEARIYASGRNLVFNHVEVDEQGRIIFTDAEGQEALASAIEDVYESMREALNSSSGAP